MLPPLYSSQSPRMKKPPHFSPAVIMTHHVIRADSLDPFEYFTNLHADTGQYLRIYGT